MMKATIKGIEIQFETVSELKEFLKGENNEQANDSNIEEERMREISDAIKKRLETLNETTPTPSQLDVQVQCPRCFSTRVGKKGHRTYKGQLIRQYKCKKCKKVFTTTKNTKEQNPTRRKHRNTWPEPKQQQYIQDYKTMTPKEIQKKYNIKGINTVYGLMYQFMNKNKTTQKPVNPNAELRQKALQSLRGGK